jgi:hypothetical protein
VLALYYVGKGFRTRRDSGASVFGLVLAAIFALAAIATSVGMVFLYTHGFAKK